MSQAATTPEEDLSEQLKAIVIEAASRVEPVTPPRSAVRAPAAAPAAGGAAESAMPSWMKPLLEGIEALNRAHNENALRLTRIEKRLDTSEQTNEHVPQMLAESRQALDQRNVVSRMLFEALHAELKSYKDAFMLESVLKPVIRDLITLYDDMTEIRRQTVASLNVQQGRAEVSGGELFLMESVQTMGSNVEHNVHFILEVLERLEVTLIPENHGKLDKRIQRAVAVESAENAEQDQQVVKIVKRGFHCRDRVVRPEEVVIRKWKEGCLVALPTPNSPQPSQPK
jgi:molecular chaperone GrpE (heat shock protein)